MKRISIFLLSLVLNFVFVLSFAVPVSAKDNVIISGSRSAKVIEVIDGDAIKVQLLENNDTALVRLIGVDAQGYNEAVTFLTQYLLGQTVVVSTDYNIVSPSGIWNNMYVSLNGQSVNAMLIEKGYGIANGSHIASGEYSTYLTAQRTAKGKNIGIWEYGVRENTAANNYGLITYVAGNSYKTGINININTATAETLAKELNNVTSSVASNIVRYREKNPFNTIDEIKFVDGFTKDLFNENKNIIVVCTNINDADEQELYSLGFVTEDEVDDVISYRKRHNDISYISILKEEKLISETRYNKIKDYIAIRDKDKIDITINETTVNINSASQSNLTSAGMSSTDASKVIDYRTKGYTYKTLMELVKIPGIGLSESNVNQLEDNLSVKTDINDATASEMKSVFGNDATKVIAKRNYYDPADVKEYVTSSKYETIKNIIYTGAAETNYVNLNTATTAQLTEMGFSSSDAAKLAAVSNMKTAKDLPVDISYNNANAALYTNINTASKKELQSLNHGITEGLISEIISYREEQVFGSKEEISEFFNQRNAFGFYNSVKEYLVVR